MSQSVHVGGGANVARRGQVHRGTRQGRGTANEALLIGLLLVSIEGSNGEYERRDLMSRRRIYPLIFPLSQVHDGVTYL